MSRLTDLIAQAKAKDPTLGQELEQEFKVLSSRRSFGLNFERHRPESVELPGRPVRKGDKVRTLPPRGKTTKGDQRLLRKRNAFRHEKEVRLIYVSPTSTKPSENLYFHDFDCLRIVEQIMLHPQLSELEARTLISGIANTTGFKGEILQSRLYRLPNGFKAVIKTH